MPQKLENTYVIQQKNSFSNDAAHKEICMEYPFSHSVKKDGNEASRQFSVKELAELWLTDIQEILRPSSYACYQAYTSKYIIPYIGQLQAGVFCKEDLFTMLEFLRVGNGKRNSLSQYTIYVVESIVRAMFRYGAEMGLVPEIAFGKAGYIIKNKKDALPLSELEMQQLINTARQHEMDIQIQVMLPLYTGASLSELCGLKWEDIDLENGKIHIHRNLMRVQQKKLSSKEDTENISDKDIKSNKSKKMATVLKEFELPESECREFIIPEKLARLLELIAEKKNPEKERYVATIDKKCKHTGKKYSPPDGRTLQNHLKSLGEQAWIPELTFKRLRDTFAVMCLQAGGDLYSVAYVLGVGINAVCERYGQWLVKSDSFIRGIG